MSLIICIFKLKRDADISLVMSYFATHHELDEYWGNSKLIIYQCLLDILISEREYLTTISVYPSKDFDFFLSAGIYIMISLKNSPKFKTLFTWCCYSWRPPWWKNIVKWFVSLFIFLCERFLISDPCCIHVHVK